MSSPRIFYFFQELLPREIMVALLMVKLPLKRSGKAWVTLLSGLETKLQQRLAPKTHRHGNHRGTGARQKAGSSGPAAAGPASLGQSCSLSRPQLLVCR